VNARNVVRTVSTPITLVILLGLLTAGVWWGYKIVSAKVVQTTTPCVTMAMTELTTSSVTVNVYNSGSLAGLAGRVSTTLIDGGFIVGTVGNASNNVQTVMITGANADDPEVRLVASWFVDPAIQADGRANHTVDVYVGNDFDEQNGIVPNAPASLPISTGQVCLPASATPTPETTEEPVDGPAVPGEEPGEGSPEPPVLGPPAPEEPN